MASSRLDFSAAHNIINPYNKLNESLASTQSDLTALLAQSSKEKLAKQALAQQAFANKIASAEELRKQSAYDKKIKDQGTIREVLSAKDVGKSDVDTAYLNQQYIDLANKYGLNDPTSPNSVDGNDARSQAYRKDLEALNAAVGANIEAGTDQYYGSHAQIVNNIQRDLMSKDIDYQTAKTLAESKAQDIRPVIAAKDALAQKKYDLDLHKAMYPNKSGNNNVYIDSGSSSSTGGANKTVTTRGQAVDTIANIIKENDDGQDFKSWLEDGWGQTPATATHMWELVKGARKAHVSDYQIAAELQSSIKKNFVTKDTIPNLNDFVKRAKLNNTKSSRVTTKGNNNSLETLIKETSKEKSLRNLAMQNSMMDQKSSPTFDRYQYALDNAFDKAPYKSKEGKPKNHKSTSIGGKSTSLFTGDNEISKAMLSNSGDNALKTLFNKNQSKFWKQYKDLNTDEQKKVDTAMGNYPAGTFNTEDSTITSYLDGSAPIKDQAMKSAVDNQLKLLNDPNMSPKDKLILKSKIANNITMSTFRDIGVGALGLVGAGISGISNFSKRSDEPQTEITGQDVSDFLRGDAEYQKESRAKYDFSPSVTDGVTFPKGNKRTLPTSPSSTRNMKDYIKNNLPKGVTAGDINKLSPVEIKQLYILMSTPLNRL